MFRTPTAVRSEPVDAPANTLRGPEGIVVGPAEPLG